MKKLYKEKFPIVSDPIITVGIILIFIVIIFTIFMIKYDSGNPYNATKFIEKISSEEPLKIQNNLHVPSIMNLSTSQNKYSNHTTIIKTWTQIPGEGYNDCTQYGSGFGGSGQNSSISGSCYKCNCTSIEYRGDV